VRSLAAEDPAYRPHHLDFARYHFDEAYHNGDVWLWLSGAYVSALPDPRDGYNQTRLLLDAILAEGAAGTLQEIRDGDAAPGRDEFGGATSQAWSLAELLRTVVDDHLGLEVDLTGRPPRVAISPRLPVGWPWLAVRTRIGDRDCLIECRPPGAAGGGAITLRSDSPLPDAWVVALGWDGGISVENANAPQRQARSDDPRWGFCLEWRGE
jgi:hypothetical protein